MKLNIKKIARDKVGDYTVSTVCKDGLYETAICKFKNNYVVVQRYPDEVRARIAHKGWVEFCETQPVYALDVDTKQQTLF
jgi:hypothetical protein